jgi:hypothetical protein
MQIESTGFISVYGIVNVMVLFIFGQNYNNSLFYIKLLSALNMYFKKGKVKRMQNKIRNSYNFVILFTIFILGQLQH